MIKPLPSTDGGDTSCNDDRDGHDKSGTSDENIAFQNIEAGRKSNYADGVIRYESTLRGDNSRPLIFQNDDDHLTGNFRDPELEMEGSFPMSSLQSSCSMFRSQIICAPPAIILIICAPPTIVLNSY